MFMFSFIPTKFLRVESRKRIFCRKSTKEEGTISRERRNKMSVEKKIKNYRFETVLRIENEELRGKVGKQFDR